MTKAKVIDYGDWVEELVFYGLPALGVLAWVVVWVVTNFLTGTLAFALMLVLWVAGFTKVNTTERAVKIFIGYPYATTEAGLRWVVPFLGSLDKRSTLIQELEFVKEAGIVTRAGKARDADGNEISNGRVYGSATIGATVSLLFQYPNGDDLIKSVVKLPAGTEDLMNLFEEPVLDQVRTVGGDTVYINLVQRRAHFAKQVLESLKTDVDGVLSKLIRDSGLVDIQVAIKHLNIPPELMQSINAQEIAENNRSGKLIDADAERQVLEAVGKGKAAAKGDMLDVLRAHPENHASQALLTLIEMAQGPATTLFPISTDLTNVLSRVLGGGKSDDDVLNQAVRMLTPTQREELLTRVQGMLKPSGGVK